MGELSSGSSENPEQCHTLDLLRGQHVSRVSLEQWALIVLFEDSELRIEGCWQLHDSLGRICDRQMEFPLRDTFLAWKLVSHTVDELRFTDSERSALRVYFTNGWMLEIVRGAGDFEDWSFVSGTKMLFSRGEQVTHFEA